MSINVDFNGTNIIINNNQRQIITKSPNDFYALNINGPSTPCSLNTNITIFKQEQRDLRILDCMKDAKIDTNISNNVPGIFGFGYGMFHTFEKLHELEDKFINCFQNKIKKFAWTKVSKDSNLEPKFSQRIIFKESGLDAEYFVTTPIFCGNFANEIIDPAGRSLIRSGESDIVFPANGVALNVSNSFLSLFGLPECNSINATRNGNNRYTYTININGISPNINNATTNIQGQNVLWFAGNSVKNGFINNTQSLSTDIKKAIFICKELGDLLQVLIMLVWVLSNEGKQYSMVTCDKVVLLMCMLLNLNCILTYASLEDGKKLRTIDYFEPTGYTIEHATARFNTEKAAIIEENQNFINALTYLQSNPQIKILVPTTTPITFSREFYTDIIADLTLINDMLRGVTAPIDNQDTIDRALKDMKENFLFVMFIRKTGKDLKMMFAKTFTKKNTMWSHLTTHLIGYNKKLLYNIGKDYTNTVGSKRKRGGKRYNGGNPMEIKNNGISPSPLSFALINPLSVLEYPDINLTYIDEEGNPYKPYEILNSEIFRFSLNDELYETIYNQLFYEFYYSNEVLYDNKLSMLITNIRLIVFSNRYEIQSTSTYIPNTQSISQFNNINPIEQPSMKLLKMIGGNTKNTTIKNKTKCSNKYKRFRVSKHSKCKQIKTKKNKRKIYKK